MTETATESSMCLWSTIGQNQHFYLIPDGQELPIGDLEIETPIGKKQRVAADAATPYEVTEAEAVRWAREELGHSLTELKQNIEAKLDDWRRQLDDFNNAPLTRKTKVTPEAGSVFYELLAALPKVFRESTSENETRVESARETMADFERRFTESGLNIHGRLEAFPDRLAKAARKSSPSDQNPSVPPPRNR